MKAFAFALLAAIAVADEVEDNATAIVEEAAGTRSGSSIGTISALTSWIDTGSGPDAGIVPLMYIETTQEDGTSTNFWNFVGYSKWQWAFASDATTASSEIGQIAVVAADNGDGLACTYTWGNWDVTAEVGSTADVSSGNSGSYNIRIKDGETNILAGQQAPGVGFWTPDADLMVWEGASADGDEVFGIGMSRTNPGVAGIDAGATVTGALWVGGGSDTLYSSVGDWSWKAEETEPVVDDSNDDDTNDDDNTTDNTTDTTDDGDDDDTQDDAAASLSYAAALAATVYALAF